MLAASIQGTTANAGSKEAIVTWKTVKRFVAEEDGMEMVEWALVAVAIVLAGFAAFQGIGEDITSVAEQLQTDLRSGTP